eukprot:SAG31_NODE_301_length_18103_cov_13.772551_18_plen_199_part_00
MVNINGSDDPFYRYKMPPLVCVVQNAGASKMVKTSLANVDAVGASLQRPPGCACATGLPSAPSCHALHLSHSTAAVGPSHPRRHPLRHGAAACRASLSVSVLSSVVQPQPPAKYLAPPPPKYLATPTPAPTSHLVARRHLRTATAPSDTPSCRRFCVDRCRASRSVQLHRLHDFGQIRVRQEEECGRELLRVGQPEGS